MSANLTGADLTAAHLGEGGGSMTADRLAHAEQVADRHNQMMCDALGISPNDYP